MTLILSITSPNSIWTLADRRISFKNQKPIDDAVKLVSLECTNGKAILGYSGVGLTAKRLIEPSKWMKNVLVGPKSTFEDSMDKLRIAVNRELPKNIRTVSGLRSHLVLITGIIDNEESAYSISVGKEKGKTKITSKYGRYIADPRISKTRPPRIITTGSGSAVLKKNKDWRRPLLRAISNYDKGKISSKSMAMHMAKISLLVSAKDKYVGRNAIVLYRNANLKVNGSGGASFFFEDTDMVNPDKEIPTIGLGMDVNFLAEITEKAFLNWQKDKLQSEEEKKEYIERLLKKYPENPDTTLT